MSMNCPKCDSPSKCVDTRRKDGFNYRRYCCLSDIHHKWTTVEFIAQTGSGKPIDMAKIIADMSKSENSIEKLKALKNKILSVLEEY